MSKAPIVTLQTGAQALLDSDVEQGHASPDTPQWGRYEVLFRAAIDTIREPSEAMLNAARDWSVGRYGRGVGNDDAIGCWHAMVDAILAPEQPK